MLQRRMLRPLQLRLELMMLDGSPTEVSTPRGRPAGATAYLYSASSSVMMLLPIEYLTRSSDVQDPGR